MRQTITTERALIDCAIRRGHLPFSFHLSGLKIALVYGPVTKGELAFAIKALPLEFTLIGLAIGEVQHSAHPLPVSIRSPVYPAIRQGFRTFSVLQAVTEASDVISAIGPVNAAIAVQQAIFHITFIVTAIRGSQGGR